MHKLIYTCILLLCMLLFPLYGNQPQKEYKTWDKGTFETNMYRNLFAETGYPQEKTDAKPNDLFYQVFEGKNKVYFEVEDSMAYISDLKNNDVPTEETTTLSGLKLSDFNAEVEGKTISLYVLKNKNGLESCITNYGGRLVSLMVPDKNGKLIDVVLGFDKIDDYFKSFSYFGALIGRYANRISNSSFMLDGVEYKLNGFGQHCLHGGIKGYHACIWNATQINGQTLELSYFSPDGDAGFPGNINIKVTYTLTDDNEIDIQYEATTDKPTVINLTNHSYFNISGTYGSNVLEHLIQINADEFTPLDSTFIPTGAIESVTETPMDLRKLTYIGAHIDDNYAQLKMSKGYDHNWILNTNGNINELAAKAISENSGIVMDVYTNEPCMQFYTGMGASRLKGKSGVSYPSRGAFCLETQHYPNSPNQPNFPNSVIRPGEKYLSRCIYKFSVQNSAL